MGISQTNTDKKNLLNILGIETATRICGIAVLKNTDIVVETKLNIKNIHARQLMSIIHHGLEHSGLAVSELDGIAVSIGPGSFTGLRIGLSAAKGLALPFDIPVIPVPTFDAMATSICIPSGSICTLLQARADEYYVQLFERKNGATVSVKDIEVLTLDKVKDFAPAGSFFVGQTERMENPEIIKNGSLFNQISAGYVALLGKSRLESGKPVAPSTLEPDYYQNFIAGKPKKLVLKKDDDV